MHRPAQIFLCYARQDAAVVSALYEKLSLAGFHPFMDTKDILPGEGWKLVLMNTIRESPFFLACLSNNSVDKRGIIQEEIREALDVWRQKLDSDIYFIPVRLEDCSVPDTLAKFQWVDLFHENGFERLTMALNIGMKRLGLLRPLRSRPATVSPQDVTLMMRELNFFDSYMNNVGKGIKHEYERHGKVVFDKTTGLTWQQSSSPPQVTYAAAEEYTRKLNYEKFAGYIDWRLPTLEEAMSLMEPEEKTGDLYIDPVFDRRQRWIWTADKQSVGLAWYAYFVYFDYGVCNSDKVDGDYFVRVVRSEQ